ncbi:replicative DNA helicase [Rhizorhabdus sp.]|uniref:replicative DNA helicase n=1 Tax=Rhizorhabdus sp. TaxID=1968843 RepID=UPI0035B3A0D9
MRGAEDGSFAAAKPINDERLQQLTNLEAEMWVIGSLLRNNDGLDGIIDFLAPDDFSDPLFGTAYAMICEDVAQGKGANPVTIGPRIRDLGQFDGRNAVWELAESTNSIFAGMPPTTSARTIADLASRRRFIAGLAESIDLAFDTNAALGKVAAATDENVAAALRLGTSRSSMVLAEAWRAAVDRIRKIRSGEIRPSLKLVGLSDVEHVTGGLRPGDFILLGGRPSMGKTALSLAIARRATEAGHGVLYISREMDTVQLMPRMVADLMFEAGSPVTFEHILKGEVTDRDLALMAEIEERISGWPLVIDDPSELRASQIAPLVRRHQRAMAARGQSLDMVIIDYLGLIDPPEGRQSRNDEVSVISRTIKQAARSCRVAIVALTQLNRAVEQREDKRPMLSDLRDSGSLEQDADTVVFVYRDEYYLGRSEPPAGDKKYEQWAIDMGAARDRVDIYSAKVRQGAITKRTGYFFGSRQAIRNSDYYRSGF